MSTPADELKAAAQTLRAAAAVAAQLSPPPWLVTDELVIRCSNKERGIVADRSCEPEEAGDLEYIAAMHPGVGAALADWLEVQAAEPVAVLHSPACPEATCTINAALAVARAINGLQ